MSSGQRRGYHQGNLRAALIRATLDLIADRGPRGFTMAEVARAAGVSPAAPYRHFRGKDDLIAAAAREGFAIFARMMARAVRDAPTPLAAVEATGRAYLAFARRHPGHYVAMFESGLRIDADPDLARAAEAAMSALTRATEALLARLPPAQRPPAPVVSQHVRALSHGVVELFARAEPGSHGLHPPEEILETGIGIYLRGLGILPPDADDTAGTPPPSARRSGLS